MRGPGPSGLAPQSSPETLARHTAQDVLFVSNAEQFEGGLVLKVHRLVYFSTLGSRVQEEEEDVCKE